MRLTHPPPGGSSSSFTFDRDIEPTGGEPCQSRRPDRHALEGDGPRLDRITIDLYSHLDLVDVARDLDLVEASRKSIHSTLRDHAV